MKYTSFYYFIVIFIIFTPWLMIQIPTRISGDAAFLYMGLEMLMQGKAMSEYFYDNNPPMSFLIYYPAALLNKIGISTHFAIQIYIIAFTLISLFLSYYFLGKYKTLKPAPIFIILIGYLGAVTLLSYAEYGQKDHLIAIALTPFILMQLSISNKHKASLYIIWITALLYAPFILIKPHFGILPVALILQRIYISKKLQINIDFTALAIATISYILFVILYMPDYISEILPASLLYYIGNSTMESILKTTLALIMLGGALTLLAKTSDAATEAKKLCFTFAWLATLSILPFWVQAKGFSLHLLPSLSLMSITACLLIYFHLKKPLISITIITALFYCYFAFAPHIATKTEYENYPLAKILHEKAGDQPFFMESYTTNIISTQSLYAPNIIASRFPSLWTLANFNKLTKEEQKHTWNKYGRMIAQDIERNSPKLIALIKTNDEDKGFLALFKNHKEFQEQWKNYKYDSEFTMLQATFYEKNKEEKLTYNIYLRKQPSIKAPNIFP